jgi:6-phosphogluconolactonase
VVEPEIVTVPASDFATVAADTIADLVNEAVGSRGRCRVGLAGGGTPAPIYELLSAPPLVGRMPWSEIEWYWGDERAVPPDDPGSNYAMVRRCMLDAVDVLPRNVHRIRGELGAPAAADAYSQVLGDDPIDVLLLGMGGDGHTASLFPDSPGPDEDAARVCATTSPVAPFDRVSLTFGAINSARVVVFLVAGGGKAARLAEVRAQQTGGNPALPAARVQPAGGRLIWLLDAAAAENLEESR